VSPFSCNRRDRRKLGGSAPGLARVVGAVQAATARAAFVAGFGREILVDCQQVQPEAGGTEKFVIHGRVLRCGDTLRSTPLGEPDQAVRLFEGNSLGRVSDLARESRISRRLACPLSAGSISVERFEVHAAQVGNSGAIVVVIWGASAITPDVADRNSSETRLRASRLARDKFQLRFEFLDIGLLGFSSSLRLCQFLLRFGESQLRHFKPHLSAPE
jgi:hypothetical protein